jgi:L-2,4-diaminobutyric acid acetyltransferase
MPEQRVSTDPVDPSTTSGGVSPAPPASVAIREPTLGDGALLWKIACDAGGLDVNTPYAYMMACRNFPGTCAIAEVQGQPAGFVMAHRIPTRPDALFIWQVAVLAQYRGLGIARRLIDVLADRDENAGVRVLEATVTPSNSASGALFAAFAKDRQAQLAIRPGFAAEDFPQGQTHEAEDLYVISPLNPIARL